MSPSRPPPSANPAAPGTPPYVGMEAGASCSAVSADWFGGSGERTWSAPTGVMPKVLVLNWNAKSDMGCSARLVKVTSKKILPARRAKVPWISRPLAADAGSRTFFGSTTRCSDAKTSLMPPSTPPAA